MDTDHLLYHAATHTTRDGVWIGAVVAALLGLLLVRYWRWGLLIAMPLSVLIAWHRLVAVWHPRVGPIVRRDVAWEFLLEWHLAAALALAAPLLGLALRRRAVPRRPIAAEQGVAGDVRPGIVPEEAISGRTRLNLGVRRLIRLRWFRRIVDGGSS